MLLSWDGLQLQIPTGFSVADLGCGFIHLATPENETISLRYSGTTNIFQPQQDGRKLLRAASLPQEPIVRCQESWTDGIAGSIYSCTRLWILAQSHPKSVVALLFSFLPDKKLVKKLLSTIFWTPVHEWRSWLFYRLSFRTPPGFALKNSLFHPGRIALSFHQKRTTLIIERLNPADVLLGEDTLYQWGKRHLQASLGSNLQLQKQNGTGIIALHRLAPPLYRVAPWFGHRRQPLNGSLQLHAGSNSLLLIVIIGKPLEAKTWNQIRESYDILDSDQS